MNRGVPRHPMAVVTRRTGLRPDVIRAWERRHDAVKPGRSAGNHRLYSDADIRRLLVLRRAVDAGWQIGHVASLEEREIERLIEDAADSPVSTQSSARTGSLGRSLRRCLDAIAHLDEEALRRQLEAATLEVGRIDLLDHLLVPLINEIGGRCNDGSLRMANEHLATAVLRSFIDGLNAAYPADESAPGLIATTPCFQHHELGALLVTATARGEGWRTTYLGPNLPAEEIAAAAVARSVRVVALSISYPPDDPRVNDELRRLARFLEPTTALVAGGASAKHYGPVLEAVGATHLTNLGELRRFLHAIRRTVPGVSTEKHQENHSGASQL